MSGVKLTQCLLFFVHESGQDIAAATSSSSIQFYALLPEVFRTEYPEFFKLFTENGIVVMSTSDGSSQQFAQGNELEILEILFCVTSAAAPTLIVVNGNLHRVKRIFSSCSSIAINTRMNNYSKVKVHPAVNDNNAIIMERILSLGKNICYKHPSGESLLHLAAERGHETFAKVILEHGINVNSKCIKGLTPLHVAVNGGYRNIVDVLLLNGADVGIKTNMGSTALHIAAEERHYSIVESLLRNGADIESKTEKGLTELSLAVLNSDADIKLLLRNGADPDCRDHNGRTPLFMTENLRPDIAEVLLSYGARLNVKLANGQFGLSRPQSSDNGSLFQLLLESCFRDPEVLTFWEGLPSFVWEIGLRIKVSSWLRSLSEHAPHLIRIRHLVKIIAANLYPLQPFAVEIGKDLVAFKVECESEVAQMKERIVSDTSSLLAF